MRKGKFISNICVLSIPKKENTWFVAAYVSDNHGIYDGLHYFYFEGIK